MKKFLILSAVFAAMIATTSVRAESRTDQARRAYDSFQRKTTHRVNSSTSVRPNTNGIEVNHRGRSSQTQVHIGQVRQWGSQAGRSAGYGVGVGISW